MNILKKILPSPLYNSLFKVYISLKMRRDVKVAFRYDYKRYIKYSSSFGYDAASTNLIGKIIREYHVVEKGLTMHETKLGFGKAVVLSLIEDCIQFIRKYGDNDEQVKHAIEVVFEYGAYHKQYNFELDEKVTAAIGKLKEYLLPGDFKHQREVTRDLYFQDTKSSFDLFSKSRNSIRNFTNEEISIHKIETVLQLAANAPSACNRQAWRTYIVEDKNKISQILEIQGGNRGFGYLANKLIVIAADVSLFFGPHERNQVFVDGGIYAMNVLYALHYNSIGACILNCSNSKEKDLRLRKACPLAESEVYIAMVVCGIPPDNFKIASSKRYSINKTNNLL